MQEFETGFAVIGGVYGEFVQEPLWKEAYGSGLRAATLLAANKVDVTLCAPIDEQLRDAVLATASGYQVAVREVARKQPIWFNYQHPLGTPGIDFLDQTMEPFMVRAAEGAVVFGMLECDPYVQSDFLVFDPQSPRGSTGIDTRRLASKRLAIVANATEIRTMGGHPDERLAAQALLEKTRAETIVVKDGPRGASVLFEHQWSEIGPFETDSVWKLGSGDVFTAAFALAWINRKLPPSQAARLASAATSYWCATRAYPTNLGSALPSEVALGEELRTTSQAITVYLAGPFFNVAERWLVENLRSYLTQCGAQVFSPLHDVGKGGDEVAAKDISGLLECRVVLALLDGSDPGTVFEVGFATAKGIPVVGFVDAVDSDDLKMIRGTDTFVTRDLTTAVYKALWAGMKSEE